MSTERKKRSQGGGIRRHRANATVQTRPISVMGGTGALDKQKTPGEFRNKGGRDYPSQLGLKEKLPDNSMLGGLPLTKEKRGDQ